MRKHRQSNYTIVELPKNNSPFSFFNYIFISPKGNYSEEEWKQIIIHETTHARQLHSLDMLLLEIVKIIFWWNPLVYFYKMALRDVHEFQADQATTQNHDKKEYSRLLFRQSQSGMQTAVTSNFIHSQLKKRIKMMMSKRSKRTEIYQYLMIIPLLTALFFVSCQQDDYSKEVAKQEAKKTKDEIVQLVEDFKGKEQTPENKAEFQRRAKELVKRIEKNPNFKKNEHASTQSKSGRTIFKAVNEMPQFQGCNDGAGNGRLDKCSEKALLKFIYNQIQYPQEAREKEIQGRVIASFVVNKSGKLDEIKVLRGIGGGCDEEVIRILDLMNDQITWTPGRQDGQDVNVQYILPVKFELQ